MNKETRISPTEMAIYRERLMKQKQFLTDILSKIEKQILALQVERLHLRNSLLRPKCLKQENILPDVPIKKDCMKTEPGTEDRNDLMQQKLDLSVAPSLNEFEEFEDDELDFLSSP